MFKVYAAYRNGDMTEGRGPMIIDKIFLYEGDANEYIDTKSGIFGRKPPSGKWSTENYGDWQVRTLDVYEESVIKEKKRLETVKIQALNKLTDEEKCVLGL